MLGSALCMLMFQKCELQITNEKRVTRITRSEPSANCKMLDDQRKERRNAKVVHNSAHFKFPSIRISIRYFHAHKYLV